MFTYTHRIEFQDLNEERATAYSRLGKHQEALEIYCTKLKDFKGAEEYCIQHYELTEEANSKVFQHLFVYYDQMWKQDSLSLDYLVEFINQYSGFLELDEVSNICLTV